MILALNNYRAICSEPECGASVDIVSPADPQLIAHKLREAHWLMTTTDDVEVKIDTPTWCPFHGPDLHHDDQG